MKPTYPNLRRSLEKKLTRKTTSKEKMLLQWMIQKNQLVTEQSHTT
ncbi:hypothetical protein [Bacillus suaedae]|uniref:Uncharacterized protein n=1 Tax=Halalkalibacter suaedae TaxID=2822140 RepID=A0A940WUY3_9BACI|nr:hypothetical protein [Bacillus suaedae]MBP3952208.1 hypothetical protein [Bacillus suaedae]